MKLYHGTNIEFEFIDIEHCPPLTTMMTLAQK